MVQGHEGHLGDDRGDGCTSAYTCQDLLNGSLSTCNFFHTDYTSIKLFKKESEQRNIALLEMFFFSKREGH